MSDELSRICPACGECYLRLTQPKSFSMPTCELCCGVGALQPERVTAWKNAKLLAGLNPEGIPGLISAVEQVVAVLNVAKMQYGWEDSTNVLSTLEGALRGCALTPEPPAT